jgi:hypothetical protein
MNSMNSIRLRNFLLMTKDEVVADMIQYFNNMMPTNEAMLAGGYKLTGLPDIILAKGLGNLSAYELQTISEPWAEDKLERVANEMKNKGDVGRPPILIIMTYADTNSLQFTPYFMNPIYKDDYQAPANVAEGYC